MLLLLILLAEPTVEESPTTLALQALLASVADAEADIASARISLRSEGTSLERDDRLQAVATLNRRRDELLRKFEAIAVGFEVGGAEEKPKAINLPDELRDLLGPILHELKSVTERPRQIDALRGRVALGKERRERAASAIRNVDQLLRDQDDKAVQQELQRVSERWRKHQRDVENDLQVAEVQLQEKLNQGGGMVQNLRTLTTGFVRTRGRNLLLAALAFFGVLAALTYSRRKLFGLLRAGTKRSMGPRVLDVAAQIGIILLAVFAALLVLYAAADWVLLGLASLFLVGLGWATKHTLPGMVEQIKLILNLGSVREGERVVVGALPWQVQRIHFYTDLVNPQLRGGHLRLPLRALMELHSRPIDGDEVWFPTAEGDWLLLDGEVCRVSSQTPNWVQLSYIGGATQVLPTQDFLGKHPLNLNSGFRVRCLFGIDYKHQGIATREAPEILKGRVAQAAGAACRHVSVEFAAAGASSLDLRVDAEFAGDAAPRLEALRRMLARVAVETCTEQGWTIPFTQVTLHHAGDGG
jgi:hypothetical protein